MEHCDYQKLNGKRRALKIIIGFTVAVMVLVTILFFVSEQTFQFVVCSILMAVLISYLVIIAWIERKLKRTTVYGHILDEDHDGSITLERIGQISGYPVSKVKKDIKWSVDQGLLRGFDYENNRLIMDDLKEVICATCGALNLVREDGSGKCKNCGSYLKRG